MRHPTPGELLEHHFDDDALAAADRDALAGHLGACAACRAILAEVAWVEQLLGAEPEETPPADGLERVLARVEAVRPARERRLRWLCAAGPSAAGLLAGTLAVQVGGLVAAIVFFGIGSLVTLALAPVLILEAQGRS